MEKVHASVPFMKWVQDNVLLSLWGAMSAIEQELNDY